jgi:hypothetical protein
LREAVEKRPPALVLVLLLVLEPKKGILLQHQPELRFVAWAAYLIVERSDSPEAKKPGVGSLHPLMCEKKAPGKRSRTTTRTKDEDEIVTPLPAA